MGGTGRSRRFSAGFAFVVLVAPAVGGGHGGPEFPAPARQFTFGPAASHQVLVLDVRSPDGAPRQVTVMVGASQASFLHRGRRARRYRVRLPAFPGRDEVTILAEPSAVVALGRRHLGLRTRTPDLRWQMGGPPRRLPLPIPAGTGRPWAEASVDETDTWGLRLLGIPLREAAAVGSGRVVTASHGDRLRATCWALGDEVTNGFPDRREGAYASNVWYRVETSGGPAFISDVRFARRGAIDRLGLPPCPEERLPG